MIDECSDAVESENKPRIGTDAGDTPGKRGLSVCESLGIVVTGVFHRSTRVAAWKHHIEPMT